MRYKAPNEIINHPGVATCDSGEAEGMDYKHAVFLKDGWQFASGRMAGCRTGNFHNVKDFRYAKPEKVAP